MDSDHTLRTNWAMSTGEGEGQGRNKSQCQDPNTLLGPHTVIGHPWLRTLAPWALPSKGHLISVKPPGIPGAFPQPLAVPTSSPLNAQAPSLFCSPGEVPFLLPVTWWLEAEEELPRELQP